MMKLLCLALVLLINWTQAIPPDELAAYIHFFDTEDDMMSDDFKTEDIMHPALVGEGLANPPEIPITSAKNNVYFDQWLFPEPKVDSYEAKNPLLTTNKASSHKEIDVTVEKDSSNEILSTPDATSTLSGGKTKHHFLNKNKISFTDVREQDGLAQPFNLSDFFNQLVKLCIESIGLVMDSFMGAIKTTSTEKSPGDSIYDDFYDLRSATTKSKIIKKRDASEPPSSLQSDKKLSEETANETTLIENLILKNDQETTEESVVSPNYESETNVTEILTPSISASSVSVSTDKEKSGQESSTFEQKATSKAALEKQEINLSSHSTDLSQLIKATEKSGITTKLVNNQMLDDMLEDDLNARLHFLPREQETIFENENSQTSFFAIGGTLLVVAILASAGTAAAYKFRQRREGENHGQNIDPIMA